MSETISREETETYLNRNGADILTKSVVHNGVEAANKLQLWNWFRTYNPPSDKGYMWDSNPNIEAMGRETDAAKHSGASFAFTMRYLQRMARDRQESPGMFMPEPPAATTPVTTATDVINHPTADSVTASV
jgi:hypothetical protein